jgi:hypothetical protein
MPEGIGYDDLEATLSAEEQSERLRQQAIEIRRQKEALVQKWAAKIKRARKHDEYARKRWADDRRVARGETDWLVSTNLIAAILEVLAAFLYAKNPDISVKPSQSVNRARLKEYRSLGETMEIVVSRMLRDAGLKRVAKRWVRSSMTVGVGWIKCAMQTRNERDPMVEQQINDLQQNLERLESLKKQAQGSEISEDDPVYAEMRSQITALEGKMERQVAQGFVLDLMAPEDVIIAPDCGEVENYLNSPWIAFDMYKDKDDALQITGWPFEKLKKANLFVNRPRKGEDDEGASHTNATQWVSVENSEGEGMENPEGFYRFTEIWSLRDGVVYTAIDGIQTEWARKEYAPRTGARFYPNFMLAFHPIDGERWPQSDVYQLKKLQDEYGRTRSNFSEHRRRAVPGIVFDETAIEKESMRKLADSQIQEYVGVKPVKPNVDMRTLFAPKTYNQVDMALYSTEPITQEMEKVSGAQDAVQGGIQVEKTATEAQILESGRGARTGARLDTLEDALTEMAEYCTQLCLLTMDRADAMRYAGPAAVWIDMTTEEALSLFAIEIKAGSTGKPKANSDREAWGTLMPLIEGMIDRVGHARMQGQEWAAKPWIALLQESMNRLDDHADLEKFLPTPPGEVVAAMTGSQDELTDEEKAEIRNKDADTLNKLAQALEKNPLFAGPAVGIVSDMSQQGPSDDIPIEEELPPAPNPLPNEIN